MNVVKRNGVSANLDESKILKCVEWACNGLNVAPSSIVEPVRKALFEGIGTKDIHKLTISEAASQISVENQDANFVAARLALQEVYKQAVNSVHYPHLRTYITLAHSVGLLADDMMNKFDFDKLNAAIVPERDFLFGYLGIQTLADRYFLRETAGGRIIEMPQHFWMRVAMGVSLLEAEPAAKALEFYNVLSKLEFVSSTPTLFNSGTRRPQLSSCYGNTVADSVTNDEGTHRFASIFGNIEEDALLSKYAGGIGTDWNRVRAEGDKIKGTSGVSSGVVPYLKIYNDTAVAVNQGGKRKGSFAPYLEPWHPDFEAFLELKKNTGDERMRAHEIYPAAWTPDLFMKRVKERGTWSFFSPKDYPELHELFGEAFEERYTELEEGNHFVRQVPAIELWRKWLTMLFETGHPWLTFKDEMNRRNPQSHVGVIHNSNLCVAPETAILTDRGYITISELEGQQVNVWNGQEFSEVTVVKTGEDQALIKVTLSDGAEIECTPYHKFYVQNKYWGNSVEKRAQDLKPQDKMIKFELPVIDGHGEFPHAYTAGFFCGDGTYSKGKPTLQLYGEKKALVGEFAIKSGSHIEQTNERLAFVMVDGLPKKFAVPHGKSIESRLKWFAGLLDADGTVARNGTNEALQIGSIEPAFLNEVRLMLQTLGVNSKVTMMREAGVVKFATNELAYETQAMYRLLIGSVDTQNLLNLGLQPKRLKIAKRVPNRQSSQFVTVLAVQDLGRRDDTYCFTEPKRHMGVFNGVLTGNCTEIALNNSDDETFVCNLGSVNLSRVSPDSDPIRFAQVVKTAMRMLDNVIDINFYPSDRARTSNMRHRPVGLGVMGYVEWLVQRGISFESDEHLQAADLLFETLSAQVISASIELAKERGPYPTYAGSKWSNNILPIDTARDNKTNTDVWEDVRKNLVLYGIRNSNCMAIAPTATISNIAGTTPCTEAAVDLVYSKTNLSGDFLVVDPTLKYGKPEIVKGMFEIDPLWVIKAAAVRQKWIDQAQSTNLFVKRGVKGKDLANIYETAWELGLKTTYYLRSESQTVSSAPTDKVVEEEASVVMCSIDSPDCEACQ